MLCMPGTNCAIDTDLAIDNSSLSVGFPVNKLMLDKSERNGNYGWADTSPSFLVISFLPIESVAIASAL